MPLFEYGCTSYQRIVSSYLSPSSGVCQIVTRLWASLSVEGRLTPKLGGAYVATKAPNLGLPWPDLYARRQVSIESERTDGGQHL